MAGGLFGGLRRLSWARQRSALVDVNEAGRRAGLVAALRNQTAPAGGTVSSFSTARASSMSITLSSSSVS